MKIPWTPAPDAVVGLPGLVGDGVGGVGVVVCAGGGGWAEPAGRGDAGGVDEVRGDVGCVGAGDVDDPDGQVVPVDEGDVVEGLSAVDAAPEVEFGEGGGDGALERG